ncbi:MAG: hypothetical protein KDD50_03165, partial [Bdellovibrionales bacterium]|nr:hypothetical protein [Bdellovibrionales bacterium]
MKKRIYGYLIIYVINLVVISLYWVFLAGFNHFYLKNMIIPSIATAFTLPALSEFSFRFKKKWVYLLSAFVSTGLIGAFTVALYYLLQDSLDLFENLSSEFIFQSLELGFLFFL